MRFPFLKVQLLRDNPCGIPDVHEWPALLQQHFPLFPLDVIESFKVYLKGQEVVDSADVGGACEAGRDMQLHVACHVAPPAPPPLPSALLLGLEDGSIIAAEVAVGVRVFVDNFHSIAAQCRDDGGRRVTANVLVEVWDGVAAAVYLQTMQPDETFYFFRLALNPGNYTIVASISSAACPDLVTRAPIPYSVTIVTNEQLLAMQPQRVPMAVVDQIVFNACVAQHEFKSCTGFTMHGDLGYIGEPRHALWSRKVRQNENVVFFYQWGVDKAPRFPNSVVRVLVAMESRAAEPSLWQHIDSMQFDAPPHMFDFVLTHDRALLQRAPPALTASHLVGFCAARLYYCNYTYSYNCSYNYAAGTNRAMFVPHGGLLLTADEVGVYEKTGLVSMVRKSPACERVCVAAAI
jgi:hypothetical protein